MIEEFRPPTDQPDPRWPTALHEAGHAVAAVLLCVSFTQVTIIPSRRDQLDGHIRYRERSGFGVEGRNGGLARRLAVTFAGYCAEVWIPGI